MMGGQQELVWDQIFKTLNEDEQERIEFIYTETPSEVVAYSTGTDDGADSSEFGKG